MLSSRYATGLGYNPSLWTGAYPAQPARQNALADLYEPQAPSFQPPPAPQQPGPSLTNAGGGLLTGSAPEEMGQGAGTGDARGDPGPQAGNAERGFGTAPYGWLGGALGTLAGAAMGIPGLGLAVGALGTYADVRGLNQDLETMGLPPGVSFGSAFANNATLGLAGTSATDQFGNAIGFESFAEAPLSAFSGGVTSGGATSGDAGGFSPEGQQAVNDMNAAISEGFGPESAGWGGGDPGGGNGGGGGGDYGGIGDSGYGGMDGGYGGNAADGWMRGGYTGAGHDGMVDPYALAGTVHEGEIVIPAHQVARYGVEPLMALVRGQAPANALAGMLRGPAPTSANALLSQIRYG